ncbi:MAG: hypothetical protein JNM25_07045 [Planctomycetes bacterium]|nr:hypothetical protein [Planctomycetota bacterium]
MPEIADLNAELEKKRAGKGIVVSSLTEVELPKADEIYEITVAGLG